MDSLKKERAGYHGDGSANKLGRAVEDQLSNDSIAFRIEEALRLNDSRIAVQVFSVGQHERQVEDGFDGLRIARLDDTGGGQASDLRIDRP